MENLTQIRDSIKALKPLENKILKLNERLHNAESKVEALLRKYEKESLDVEQIQKETVSSFILKVIGRFEERLEKERREEIEAKLGYDIAVSEFEEIKRERQELGLRLASLRRKAQEYGKELENRRQQLQQRLSESDGKQYKQYEDEIDAAIAQMTEIDEALKAVIRAKSTVRSATDSLKSADGWATYDIWAKGGFFSHAAKYSHIDNAEACFNRLNSQIKNLRKELGDVQGLSASDLTQISPMQRSVDFWFDNIFTDISVRSQIRDNIERLNHLTGSLNEVETLLNHKSREISLHLDCIKRKQEDLLISL